MQAAWLLALAPWLPAADPALAALAAQRAAARITAGEGLLTVQRPDADEAPEPRRLRFAVAADGRYDIVRSDPADPDGERIRLVSDGRQAYEIAQMSADEAPVVKRWPADRDLVARVLACLRLDAAELERDYAVALRPLSGGRHELRLEPRLPELAREIQTIVLQLDERALPRLVLLDEPCGTRHRLEIERIADDPPLDPAWFRLSP